MMEETTSMPRTDLSRLNAAVQEIRDEIAKVIVGQQEMVDLLLASILADGHVLIEGVPGVAKTLTAKLLARSIAVNFSRIQFTPDLMPSDVLGTSVFNPQNGSFHYKQGPVFSNIVLIDEINRAPAKTQAALFEVMEEKQVTFDGITYPMSAPFMVIATQNPIEQEGTYRLPEAQLDRFLFKISVRYPTMEEEIKILLHTNEGRMEHVNDVVQQVLTAEDMATYRQQVAGLHVEQKLLEYIAQIVQETRANKALYLGASPRASVAVLKAAKAFAAMSARDFVTPDDVILVVPAVLRHRVILTPEKEMEGATADEIIQSILKKIEVPPLVKSFWQTYIGDLFLKPRLYTALAIIAVLFFMRFFIHWLGVIPIIAIGTLTLIVLADYAVVFLNRRGVWAGRTHAERFSNGDENPVRIDVENFYEFPVKMEIIDEIPHQFQRRDVLFKLGVPAKGHKIIQYSLRPVKRGAYAFGRINVYVSGPAGLVMRRFRFEAAKEVPVYPSYMQMRRYQLMAIHNRLSEAGIKKMRRIGHSMEFEQIKEYVRGDDYRTVNWKATARKGQLMVNHYTDEKSQQIYCVIDKGRVMKMPFEGLSLLDYAINASLVLSNVALLKQDRAGIVTFSDQLGSVVVADKKLTQMQSILEVLYHQKTRYLESDFERLYTHVRTRITQRSLIILFTNFESMPGMQRQLPYLRKMARQHLLLVVFFENTELKQLTEKRAGDVEAIYTKTIAEKFAFEKKLIVKELQKYGILSILTAPENVTVDTLNKYLELKARQAI